jgi:hypothetical protein
VGDLVYDAGAAWSRHQRLNDRECEEDWAKPALLNRLDWYSAHGWCVAYPGDPKIYLPGHVPGRDLPPDDIGSRLGGVHRVGSAPRRTPPRR